MTDSCFTRRSVLGFGGALGASVLLPSTRGAGTTAGIEQGGGTVAGTGQWDTHQYDARNSGFAPEIEAPETTFEQWRLQFSGTPRCTPVLHGETVIVPGTDVTVCRKAESGELVWAKNSGFASLAAVDDLIVGRRRDGALVGFDGASGDDEWTTSQPTSFTGAITIAGTQAIVPVRSEVVAVDAASGDVQWTYTVETESGETEIPQAAPTVVDDAVFVDAGSEIHAIEIGSGERRWRTSLDERAGESLAASGDTLFVGGPSVRALDPATGTVRWTNAGFQPEASVAVGDGTVYASNTNVMTAIETAEGTEVWRKRIGDTAISRYPAPPVVDGRYVYVDARNKLFALRRDDGSTGWVFESKFVSQLNAPLALSDDGIFLPSGGGVMQVLRENDWPDQSFSMRPTPAVAGEQVVFDATEFSDPDPPVTYWQGKSGGSPREGASLTFEWDFTGDGEFDAGGRSGTHTYESPGTYEVTLRLSDDTESTKAYTEELTVTEAETTTDATTTDASTTSAASDTTESAGTTAATESNESTDGTDGATPGFGIGTAVAGVTAGAYALRNRTSENTEE